MANLNNGKVWAVCRYAKQSDSRVTMRYVRYNNVPT